ncbi:hypothetical protein [Candidatus Magnetomonas plexicatena]|uniref:hypothetical protein n=1 Tax=Candidatus Magnetomonas plexicatena TaxID=2552947 RepID=UPI0011039992|nr:hypothetical protein E2O03_011430 [Nitrospirales bacterium LBB_01]
MQQVLLEVDESIYDNVLWFLNQLPKDKIEIIDDTSFSEDDRVAYEKALGEMRAKETISFDQLKKELLDV